MTMSSSKSLHTLLPFNMTVVMYTHVHKYDNVYLLMLYKTEYEFENYCSVGECIMSLVSVQDSTMS